MALEPDGLHGWLIHDEPVRLGRLSFGQFFEYNSLPYLLCNCEFAWSFEHFSLVSLLDENLGSFSETIEGGAKWDRLVYPLRIRGVDSENRIEFIRL